MSKSQRYGARNIEASPKKIKWLILLSIRPKRQVPIESKQLNRENQQETRREHGQQLQVLD
jgi:hypothetical protein